MTLAGIIAVLALMTPSAQAQPKPVCELFTRAEVTGLLGQPAGVTRSFVGPMADCIWGTPRATFKVGRSPIEDANVLKQAVDSHLQSPDPGDIVKAQPGIGDAAVSIQTTDGRSLTLVFRSAGTVWTMSIETVRQKLDVKTALPKLRALATKAIQ